jgi:hypothetical protein
MFAPRPAIFAPRLDNYAYGSILRAYALRAEMVPLANQIPEDALAAIEDAICRHPGGMSAPDILRALAIPIPRRTLQYRLKHLVSQNRLIMESEGRWAKYRMPEATAHGATPADGDENVIPLSKAGQSSGITSVNRRGSASRSGTIGISFTTIGRISPST